MEQQRSRTLRELVDESAPIHLFMDREDFPSDVRNHASLLTPILNYQNIRKVISHLTTEGPEDKQQSYKFPQVASELLCIQTPNINEYLFQPEEGVEPLFEYLYSFVDKVDNYVLAGYFSKVLISVIKRHYNVQNKYNQRLCQYFFDQKYLAKLGRHLYSRSTIDLVLRILGIRTKTNDFADQKQQFLLQLMTQMQNQQLSDEIVENIYFLMDSLTSYQNNSPKACEEVSKIIYGTGFLALVFGTLGSNNRIRKTKARIVNLYMRKIKDSQEYLLYRSHIKTNLELILAYLHSKAAQKVKVTLEQVYVIDNLQLALMFPMLNQFPKVVNSLDSLFDLVFCNEWNNIFHQQVLKIVNQLWTKASPKELASVLALNLIKFKEPLANHHNKNIGYLQFLVKIGAQVSNWNKTNNLDETIEWVQFSELINQMVDLEKHYAVGDYRFQPHTLAFAYSKEMALKQYFKFLYQPVVIIYESKQEINSKKQLESLKENRAETPKKDISKLPLYLQELDLLINSQDDEDTDLKFSDSQLPQPQNLTVVPSSTQGQGQTSDTKPEVTLQQTQKEDYQMLQYWRKSIDYDFEDLLKDI